MMNIAKKSEKKCAYQGCKKPVTEEDHCAGCGFYICDEHSPNPVMGHGHDVAEHWEETED